MVSNKFLSLWSNAKQKLPMALTYFGSTASLAVSSGAQLLTFAILARHLGVEQFGLLMTITAATSLGVQLCGLGASETLVRRVANDPAIYRAALGHNLILIGASGSVLILMFTAIMPPSERDHGLRPPTVFARTHSSSLTRAPVRRLKLRVERRWRPETFAAIYR
jgi:O-antigen/teichoic acid export membrane protein